MNKLYKVGDKVICNWGYNKGLVLTIAVVFSEESKWGAGYSCRLPNGQYGLYKDNLLTTIPTIRHPVDFDESYIDALYQNETGYDEMYDSQCRDIK